MDEQLHHHKFQHTHLQVIVLCILGIFPYRIPVNVFDPWSLNNHDMVV
jgi:hypothetical protein